MSGRSSGATDTSSSCCSSDGSVGRRSSIGGEHGLPGSALRNMFHFCKSQASSCSAQFSDIVHSVNGKLHRVFSRIQYWWKPKTTVVERIRRISSDDWPESAGEGSMRVEGRPEAPDSSPSIRLATFNAAMFSMAPAVPGVGSLRQAPGVELDIRTKSANDRLKGILKERNNGKRKMKVSINLPDNDISLGRTKQSKPGRLEKGKAPSFSSEAGSNRTVMDVLREVGADVVALQNVKAEEEKGMKPLSELADGLGMQYVFAESWAPEYGNAILSKWPIKRWKVQKIDDSDHRNVLKATIDVPRAGEINVHCTHLDHLDEVWRMRQMNNILRSSEGPHLLAGGLNALDESDYSEERWKEIVKYYEGIGKPTPKVDVMRFLRQRRYADAKNFAGECEPVVVIAKGQDVQGTCKYGTRVDYILASPDSPYGFVPGSYMVVSSKGTSDHHIVRADVRRDGGAGGDGGRRRQAPKPKVVRINQMASSSKAIWSATS